MNPLFTIHNELIQMPEWKRISNIRQFKLSIQIFDNNADELIKLLSRYKTGSEAANIWAIENRPILEQFQFEIARLLHNFVAASLSLIDHVRVFYKNNYKNNEQFRDYDTEVEKRFSRDPICQFVQGLRNFYIHKKVPELVSEFSWSVEQDASNSILLNKSDLKDFKWKPIARKYLDETEKIDLWLLVSEYTKKVRDFYLWMFTRLEEIHATDLIAIDKKQQELQQAIGKIIPSRLESFLKNI